MSTVLLTEQSTPATPTTNKVRIFVSSGGTLSSVDDTGLVTTYAAGVTPEQVQDIIGGILVDTASVDLVYNDAADTISATVLPAGVNHDALQNYVANQHIDHSTVSISAGTGLTGGGDITANRTISMPNVGTAGTYRSVTTDAQGRVTAGTNPTTLAGYGITDAQPLDTDLTALAGLAGTGVIVRTGAGTATSRSVAAGTGLSVTNGDGVSGNPTVSIANIITAGSGGSATQVPAITYNAQGQLTAVTPTAIAVSASQVTDFSEAVDDRVAALIIGGTGITATYNDPANTLTIATTITQFTAEDAQDAVGTILTDTSSVDFAYNDLGNTISATVLPAGVNHNALQNYVANEHVNHSTVSISAGTGLSGGGDITTSRTLNLANTTVTAASYGSATQSPTYTVNAQGQLTTAANVLITPAFSSITATPTTLVGYGITDAQPLDSDLTALAGLAGTGLITRTATGAATTRTLTASTGITVSNGDGVSGNPTVSITNTVTAGSAGSATTVPVITYNAQGQLTAVAPTTISIPSTQVSDFVESVQDAMGGALVDSATVDFVYSDVANTQTANVITGAVNHNALLNYVANEHVNHSTVAINAGTGLSGGGDITTSRTLNIADTGVTIGTYGNAAAFPVITVNAQGQITSASTQPVPGGTLMAITTGALNNSSSATYVNIPELSLTLAANTKYKIRYIIIGRAVAGGTGLTFSLNAGTVAPIIVAGYWETSVNTTGTNRLNFVNLTTNSQFSGVAAANTDQLVDCEIVLITGGAGGTLVPQFRSEVNGSQVTIQANSFVTAEVV